MGGAIPKAPRRSGPLGDATAPVVKTVSTLKGQTLKRKAAPARKTKKAAPKRAAAPKTSKKPTAKKPIKKAVKKPAPKPTKKPARKPVKKSAPKKLTPAKAAPQSVLLQRIITSLDDDQAADIVTIDLAGRSSICDAAVIASGRSSRHVMAIADHLARRLKEQGYGTRPVTGASQGDWVLVDAGDVIVHVFRPEVRDYYDLESMWAVGAPAQDARSPR